MSRQAGEDRANRARRLDVGVPERPGQAAEHDLLGEGALPRAAGAADGAEDTEREPHVDPGEVVGRGALHVDPTRWASSGGARDGVRRRGRGRWAGPVLPSERRGRAVEAEPTALGTGARAELEDPVARADEHRVVLQHQHRVAASGELAERGGERREVRGVQTDGGLVEHEEGPGQPGAERRGERDALCLAAGEGPALPVEAEIAEADTREPAEAADQLAPRQLALAGARGQRLEPAVRLGHLESVPRGKVEPADPIAERVRVEPGTLAGAAERVRAVAAEQHAHVHLVACATPSTGTRPAVPGSGRLGSRPRPRAPPLAARAAARATARRGGCGWTSRSGPAARAPTRSSGRSRGGGRRRRCSAPHRG